MSRDQFEENLSRLLADGAEPGLSRESLRRLTGAIVSAWRAGRPGLAPPRCGWEQSEAYTWLSERLKRQPLAYFLPAAAGLVGVLYATVGPLAMRAIIALGGL
ncbi:MAG: hypothetical protein ACM3XN_07565 [Chloroflexota bacterium]